MPERSCSFPEDCPRSGRVEDISGHVGQPGDPEQLESLGDTAGVWSWLSLCVHPEFVKSSAGALKMRSVVAIMVIS